MISLKIKFDSLCVNNSVISIKHNMAWSSIKHKDIWQKITLSDSNESKSQTERNAGVKETVLFNPRG